MGITTFVAGLLGIPAPNGLIPQAPLHTASLVVMGYDDSSASSSNTAVSDSEDPRRPGREAETAVELADMEDGQALRQTSSGQKKSKRRLSLSEARKRKQAEIEANEGRREVPVAVVEQRVSNLAQGALCKLGLSC